MKLNSCNTLTYGNRARYYDPNSGRFITSDPLGLGAGDINFYRYVGNNPINYVDPMGLACDDRNWWDKLGAGYYYGTGYGENAVDYWAQKYTSEKGPWYYLAKDKCFVAGLLSSLWTEDNWMETANILLISYGIRNSGRWHSLKDGSKSYHPIDYNNIFRVDWHKIGAGPLNMHRWHIDALWGLIKHWPWKNL